MLDLNTSLLPSDTHLLNHDYGLNPVHKAFNLNAESCFPLEINHSDCDEAGSFHGANEGSLKQKLKEMISTEQSSITASSVLISKTPSDLSLFVDCEASSKHVHQHNEPNFEHHYFNHSTNMHRSYGDYRLMRHGHKALEDQGLNLHQISDSRISANDYCKLSLEGDSSSNDGKALPLESTGSVVSTNGMMEEKLSTSNLKDVPHPHSNGVPSPRDIAHVYSPCAQATTSVGAFHMCESSVEDVEPVHHITKQLFPLRPCNQNICEAGPTSHLLNYGNMSKPGAVDANFGRVAGASTCASSNVVNNSIINTSLECIGTSNLAVRPPWLGFSFPSSPHMNLPSMGLMNPITHGIQPVKKSRRGPRSRSSQYRGVTFYRRTGRWESHIWDTGKQVYLGGFDTAHAAARAYDRAAIRFRGLNADINFNLGDYESEINQMSTVSKEDFVHLLRRQSMGFSRGSSRFRGVTLHKCGRWEARMGQFLGKKAYDEAAIQCNGREAVTNFDTIIYDKDPSKESVSDTPLAVHEDDLELSLGTSLHRQQRSLQSEEARGLITKNPRYSFSSPTVQSSIMNGPPWLKQQGALDIVGQVGDGNQHVLEGSRNSPRQLCKQSFLDKRSFSLIDESTSASDGKLQSYRGQLLSANQTGLASEASSSFKLFKSAAELTKEQQVSPITRLEPPPLPPPPLAAGGWAWQMQQNVRAEAALSSSSSPVAVCTSSLMQAAAASSGFSPQQEGFTFPQWLHKPGLSYVSTASTNPVH